LNAFEVAREAVAARDCAEYYGLPIRKGRVNCFMHGGENFNMSLQTGGFNCFVCGASNV